PGRKSWTALRAPAHSGTRARRHPSPSGTIQSRRGRRLLFATRANVVVDGQCRSGQEQPLSRRRLHVFRRLGGYPAPTAYAGASPGCGVFLTRLSRSNSVVRIGAGVANCQFVEKEGRTRQMSSMRRREFLLQSVAAVSTIGLAACQPAAPAAPPAAPTPTTAPAATSA